MAVVLSPVPEEGAGLAEAVEVLAREVGLGMPDLDENAIPLDTWALKDSQRAIAVRLMTLASALVERYAPGAPQAVKNEAVIRCAGALLQSDYGGIVSEEVADMKRSYTPQPVGGWNPFRRSGAMGLLSPWRKRRAGQRDTKEVEEAKPMLILDETATEGPPFTVDKGGRYQVSSTSSARAQYEQNDFLKIETAIPDSVPQQWQPVLYVDSWDSYIAEAKYARTVELAAGVSYRAVTGRAGIRVYIARIGD